MTAAWSTTRVRWGLALLLLAALVAAEAAACGEEKKKQPRQVRVSVVVILASEKGNQIDKKLEGVAKEVQKVHPELTSFELVRLSCRSLQIDKLEKFDLVDAQKADVTILQAVDKEGRVC